MDYAALAAQYGGQSAPAAGDGAPPDYAALAAQFGGKSTAAKPVDQPAKPVATKTGSTLGRAASAGPLGIGAALASPQGRTELLNLLAGGVRGAGSIGATLMAPIDVGADAVDAALGTGGGGQSRNQQRRADMTQTLSDLGANPNSVEFGAGKVLGEVAGTAGAGGALANGLARVPGAATAVPGVINALRTGGMTTGTRFAPATGMGAGVANTLGNRAIDMGTRMVGGGATGAASAGLVDPSMTGTGATIGTILPPVLKGAGMAGGATANLLRGPEQSPELAGAIHAAREAGYVIPPSQARPTLLNRLMEGLSGKLTTAQNASAKNSATTSRLVAEDLGLAADAPITPAALKGVRDTAGQAYQTIANTGMITPGPAYAKALDDIAEPFRLTAGAFPDAKPSPVIDLVDSMRSPAFAAASAVEKIKQLRTAADDAFRTGNTDVGRAARRVAGALEDAIDGHLQVIGQPEALGQFRDARQLIAKTYSVEKALNKETGTVDARKLAAELQKGKPLSGGLEAAAKFAARFPKAAQTPEAMGSLPQTSPLDWHAAGVTSFATGNPLAMAGVALRPAARAAVLSPVVQNRLIQGGPNVIQRLIADQELNALAAPAIYRGAPRSVRNGNP